MLKYVCSEFQIANKTLAHCVVAYCTKHMSSECSAPETSPKRRKLDDAQSKIDIEEQRLHRVQSSVSGTFHEEDAQDQEDLTELESEGIELYTAMLDDTGRVVAVASMVLPVHLP